MMKCWLVFLSFFCFLSQSIAQDSIVSNPVADTSTFQTNVPDLDSLIIDSVSIAGDDFFLHQLDSILTNTYSNYFCFSSDVEVLNFMEYDSLEVPKFSPSVVKERMKLLDELTPLSLPYNNLIQSYINTYANRNRGTVSRVLGLSHLYFPMFEEKLSKYDIPLEMKYLAIIESALKNDAKSRVGAVGLWQFMPPTGKYYGLDITSYIDERRDVYKSTEAACQYLSFLYGMYDDWYLALAAYNSGPGNVNKAIRRSGGKRDYWGIRENLPRETRGYVPAFIAVNYIMNYASEHNIFPTEPLKTYFEMDTIHVSKRLRFDQIIAFTDVTEEELLYLNPTYFRGVIPNDGRIHNLFLTKDVIGQFLSNEEKIYGYKKDIPVEIETYVATNSAPSTSGKKITYKVRSGDVIGVIAQRHGVRLSHLKSWNNMRSNKIKPGQKLVIYIDEQKQAEDKQKKVSDAPDYSRFVYYTVQEGDTLWDIAKLYNGVTSKDIEQLNGGVNVKRLRKGQKIKIQAI